MPAFEAKELALTIEVRRTEVPSNTRSAAADAVKRLVRAAWLLDAFGDLGNRRQIGAAYADFVDAASRLGALFPAAP